MSRDMTADELRAAYAWLKKNGKSRYDYDEILRLDRQGRLIMSPDAVDASRAAVDDVNSRFGSCIDAFQLVPVDGITASSWLNSNRKKVDDSTVWALYVEKDDDIEHQSMYVDVLDDVAQHIPEIYDIVQTVMKHGIKISPDNVHADIRGKYEVPAVDECDGGGDGGAAGGDAGAASAGDCGGGDAAGTTTADVLGVNEPGEGYFGPGNFYIPKRVPFPLTRWGGEIGFGGSVPRRKKKSKSGKAYSGNPYTKGLKTVVDMLEDEETVDASARREKLKRNIHIWREMLRNQD